MFNVQDDLNESVLALNKVGKTRAKAYSRLKIFSLFDLICHFPRDYFDCSRPIAVKDFVEGQKCCVKARVVEKLPVLTRGRFKVFRAVAEDDFGSRFGLVFFNTAFLFGRLRVGKSYLFFGLVDRSFEGFSIKSPMVVEENSLGLIAKYGESAGINSAFISANVGQVLSSFRVCENLPASILKKFDLIDRHEAFLNVHFPKDEFVLKEARRRLIFEELFFWQLGLKFLKSQNLQPTSIRLNLKNCDLNEFLSVLPFSLTAHQLKVIDECVFDCCKDVAMNRLIQGDVGCGKTVVAQAICFLFAKLNFQVAVMAPTEILTRQHFENFRRVFSRLNIEIAMLVGSLKKSQRDDVLNDLKIGKTKIVVGTHSLFSADVEFKNLGLVITDEQHRFGVLQRSRLASKAKTNSPHVLVMSATPVPRSLALTIFADLNVSIIEKGPAHKASISTFHIPSSKRKRALMFVANEVKKGRQAYIVCPAIEESSASRKRSVNVLSYFESLKQLPGFEFVRVAVLHGKLSGDDKAKIMNKFVNHELDVLVATTVVEVGIDNPNASVIVIENAELFGLSTLHQLRGRVGRGTIDSFCILISDGTNFEAINRLKAMCRFSDGFEIAKFDLKLRGPGNFFGTMQHGLPNFRIANLLNDVDLIETCSVEAGQFFKCCCQNEKGRQFVERVIRSTMTGGLGLVL